MFRDVEGKQLGLDATGIMFGSYLRIVVDKQKRRAEAAGKGFHFPERGRPVPFVRRRCVNRIKSLAKIDRSDSARRD